MHRTLLYLIAGWSGFFVMGIELLGGRLLAPYFGSSIYVWAQSSRSSCWRFAGLPVGRPCLAVRTEPATPGVDIAGRSSQRAAGAAVGRQSSRAPVSQDRRPALWLTGSSRAAVLPADLRLRHGVPVRGTAAGADRASAGQLAGRLYFVSTFGSAAGTILTSFYLVLYLEVNQILMLMLAFQALSE